MLKKLLALAVISSAAVVGVQVGTASAGPLQSLDVHSSIDGTSGQMALFTCMDMGSYLKCITHDGIVFYLT